MMSLAPSLHLHSAWRILESGLEPVADVLVGHEVVQEQVGLSELLLQELFIFVAVESWNQTRSFNLALKIETFFP